MTASRSLSKEALLDSESPKLESASTSTSFDSISGSESSSAEKTNKHWKDKLSIAEKNELADIERRINKTENKLKVLREGRLAENKLRKKLTNWFIVDAASGSLASVAIATLYTGIQKVGNFLPVSAANAIMPFFIIADLVATAAAWKEAFIHRRLAEGRRKALQAEGKLDLKPWDRSFLDIPRAIKARLNSWKGARNALFRAIGEIAWLTAGAAVVSGAIITSTFLGTAAATAFAVVIAPAFMVILGSRGIFNTSSSIFHFIRAHLTRRDAAREKANGNIEQAKTLEMRAATYSNIARVQAFVALSNFIGFAATTVVMLLHHFALAFIGVAGGVALGGAMGYVLKGNSAFRTAVRKERADINIEMDDLIAVKAGHTITLQNKKDQHKRTYGSTAEMMDYHSKKGPSMKRARVAVQDDHMPPALESTGTENIGSNPVTGSTATVFAHQDQSRLNMMSFEHDKMPNPDALDNEVAPSFSPTN